MDCTFGDPNPEDTAQTKLRRIFQGNRTAEEYVVQFQTYETQTGFDKKALIEAFKRNMNPRLLERIYNREKTPVTLHGWQMAAIEVERQQRELQQFRGGGFRPQNTYQQRPGGQQYPSQGRLAGYTPCPYNMNSPQPKDPNAMDVDQTRVRGGNRTCYNCRKEGHFKAQCPEPRKPQRA